LEQMNGRARIPILALTANVLPADVEETSEAGCDAHLGKPISKHKLLSAIDKWCGGNGIVRRLDMNNLPAIHIPEGLEDLAQQYFAARQQEVATLNDALAKSDFKQLTSLAHNLKGTGCSFGFPGITDLGGAMEQAAKAHNVASLSEQLIRLSDYLRAAGQQMSPRKTLAPSSL